MSRVRFWYVLAVALLGSAFLALPQVQPAVEAAVGLAAVGAVELGIRRHRPPRVGAWRFLQLALVLLATADTSFAIMEVASPAPVPSPALPNVFYIAVYPALTVALLWLGRSASRYRDDTTMLDTISLTLAGGLIVWIILVRPYLLSTDLSTLGRITAIAAWLGYVTVFAASVRVLRSRRRNPAAALLAIAVFAFLVAEIFYGYELVQGSIVDRGPIDLAYFAFSALCGAAALDPSMRDIPAPPRTRHTLGRWRLTTIAAALLLGPTVLLVEASLGVVYPGVSIAIISGLVGVLILFRARMTGRAYQRRAAREHAIQAASRAMVTAITPPTCSPGSAPHSTHLCTTR